MINSDKKIYKAVLELLKRGGTVSQVSIASESGLSRKTVYNRIEANTFQNLNKYRGHKYENS